MTTQFLSQRIRAGFEPVSSLVRGGLLQRRCACGQHTVAGGECAECKKKRSNLQPKLWVDQPGDELENEANRVAQTLALDQLGTPGRNPTKPAINCVSNQSGSNSVEAPPIVHEVLKLPGRPLDIASRAFMEPRLGHDFSKVRVHTDSKAAKSARAIGALAYTVGNNVVFDEGRYSLHSHEGQSLLAHELVHVVQQSRSALAPSVTGNAAIQRKVVVNNSEISRRDRADFLKSSKWANTALARSILEDMATADDTFDFSSEDELHSEIVKRLSTVEHMRESQETKAVHGAMQKAFGYPFSGESDLYGPRVNYAAREYWMPPVSDNYAIRGDKAKNKALLQKPRSERCSVYGDPCGNYTWKLTAKGMADPYHAIAYLFAPQPPHKRSLIHCDYLVSLVNLMSFADSIGPAEFNKRIATFGAANMVLRWDAFSDLHVSTLGMSSSGVAVSTKGLGSTQRARPSSEADLIIGDHVVFFNHLAYDLLNLRVGNAWRLENAVLVRRNNNKDVFLGHGSGELSSEMMRTKLAKEFNSVAKKAMNLTAKIDSRSPDKGRQVAQADLASMFPNIKKVGSEWRMQGVPPLLAHCPRNVDEKLREIQSSEVLGLKSPCDPTKMNEVERPIESAQ